ncbi:CRISPR-associated endonuclease Cas2 [Leptolyngbya sp. 'hensonii']|uniref:CRISPR-associated endonuclease Cas2 n=1 Tax=Leptolyngbya sp. 'hensonii' TaxID=1922337 RepID=UPI00094F79FA|nr:CRISPR-associated endonuclease Cas2 [Leptolyngbya sp. 'hensonii']OLP20435.1 CRISPR-associated endonuclease Cas2 [Leptolyngbya sp. 'hensonii']
MAEAKHWYIIAYDIRCPKRWRRAYKLLQGYGESLQYSIFRCWLSQRDREKLRWELEKILTEDDRLLLTGLCNRCVERMQHCNRPESWPTDEEGHRIL